MSHAIDRGITLDPANPNFEFIRNFGFRGLWKSLMTFQCGEFESGKYLDWYWPAASHWPAKKSQAEFDAYARARLADKVGYTRRQNDAFNVIDRYFDRRKDLTFDEVIDAVTFCSPSRPMPPEIVWENPSTGKKIIDCTQTKGRDVFLKIDPEFLPTLARLYPWQLVEVTVKINKRPWKRIDHKVIKTVQVGTVTREFDLMTLAFWFKHKNANRDEMAEAIAFHSADRLDWTSGNLYSRWREGLLAERYKNRIDPVIDTNAKVPTEASRVTHDKNGKEQLVPVSDDIFLKTPTGSIVRPLKVFEMEDGTELREEDLIPVSDED